MASMETPVQNILLENIKNLFENIEQANRSLESEELLKQAQDMVVENEQVDKAAVPMLRITIIGGCLANRTKGNLSVMAVHTSPGYTLKSYPNPLIRTGAFSMSALFNKGVVSAVVYSGKNKQGVECGWLLAFADTKDAGRKIYVECGRIDKFANIDWEEVKRNILNAGIFADADDQATGTSVNAAIVGSGGKSVVGGIFHG